MEKIYALKEFSVDYDDFKPPEGYEPISGFMEPSETVNVAASKDKDALTRLMKGIIIKDKHGMLKHYNELDCEWKEDESIIEVIDDIGATIIITDYARWEFTIEEIDLI